MSTDFEAQLSAYLDGELSAEDEDRLREAIAASPGLASKLAELERVDAALAAVPVPEVPAAVKARLRASIAAQGVAPSARPPRRRRRSFVMAVAAAAAAAVLVWLVLPRAADDPLIAAVPTPAAVQPIAEAPVPDAVQLIAEAPVPDAVQLIAEAPVPEVDSTSILPDLLAPGDSVEVLVGELDAEDVAVVEVLEWLAVLEGLEPDEGRG
ncbi:MAG: hypothetical protein GY723_14000 [bacterium]|nr:hypothetical protein [bacterium]